MNAPRHRYLSILYKLRFAEWPENRGDWNEGSWLPGGIAGLRDCAHKKKLLFGLWHEPEAIVNTSSTYKAHPEGSTFNDTKDMGALNLTNLKPLHISRIIFSIL